MGRAGKAQGVGVGTEVGVEVGGAGVTVGSGVAVGNAGTATLLDVVGVDRGVSCLQPSTLSIRAMSSAHAVPT